MGYLRVEYTSKYCNCNGFLVSFFGAGSDRSLSLSFSPPAGISCICSYQLRVPFWLFKMFANIAIGMHTRGPRIVVPSPHLLAPLLPFPPALLHLFILCLRRRSHRLSSTGSLAGICPARIALINCCQIQAQCALLSLYSCVYIFVCVL